MLEQPPRLPDGRLLKGTNIVTGEERFLEIPRTCDLHPVCDDMALCHPALQKNDGRLRIADAEQAWFVRVDHIHTYGTDRDLERLTVTPPAPLLFLNIDAVPDSTALIWEHIEDSPGVTCPNPRVIIPRRVYPNIVNKPVAVDIRSMGLRTPPPAPGRSRATASSDCSMSCPRPSHGCGDWPCRAANRIQAFRTATA